MTAGTIELFYSYSHTDKALRDQLDEHLSLLKRQGFLSGWYDHEIKAGSVRSEEVNSHLQAAHIILLLISPSFLASDYCYGVEVQEAMSRHKAGTTRVVPILLRPCDWEGAVFSKLQMLPKNGVPVTKWPDRDEAFLEIAKEIRAIINDISSNAQEPATPQATRTRKRQRKTGEGMGERNMQDTTATSTTTTLGSSALKPAINRYYKELEGYNGKADYELALRSAFQNLLADTARHVNWTLIPEQTLENGTRPDGTLRDDFFARGYWEAKGPDKDLEREIEDKIKKGYPLTNIIFENTKRAVLYQNKKRVMIVEDMSEPHANEVRDLLRQFLTYTEPDIEKFETAVQEFKERIPELAHAVLAIIEQEHKMNSRFRAAFESFAQLCRSSLDPNISKDSLNEMLVQHLLTERLFRTIFDNSDFTSRNVIASEIEKVIQALTSRSFNRRDFLKSLDRFYIAIEGAAKSIDTWSERQGFLNTVYERFFQGFAIKKADTHGIVYTPQEIVDFMCASVEEVLQKEFGTSISEPGVKILDPATGTGNFIVNLIRNHIKGRDLREKYRNDLFCNEIMLLPYYIASLNIEHEYYSRTDEYEPFEGICFADTLELAEGQQLSLFVEENTERVKREKDAQIMIVIGNPPYNAKQMNENDNNKNRRYPIIDRRIRETYVKDSNATLNNTLYDAYVRFFRWATDRLQGRDGIVCYISNNSFVDQRAFAGMRKHLLKDFSQIYCLDLHGNVRKNPKLSGTTHNVFGIQVGVGITIAIRNSNDQEHKIYYHRVPEDWRKTEKLDFLAEKRSITGVEWRQLQPDKKYTWLTDGLYAEFYSFLSIGNKDVKVENGVYENAIFKMYYPGVATGRDDVVYDFDPQKLTARVEQFLESYNAEVFRWVQGGRPKDIDHFVQYNKVKWSEHLKNGLRRAHYGHFDKSHVRIAMYRPFCKKYLYYDALLNDRPSSFKEAFLTFNNEVENRAICLTDVASEKPFMVLVTNVTPDRHLVGAGANDQCFPFYTYAENGSNRHENITDWALTQFQAKYSPNITKWDIFYYVYAMLHHPQYCKYYAENLKRDLPHIPLLHRPEAFQDCVRIGQQLMHLHLNYEQEQPRGEYRIEWLETRGVPFSWRVEKMRLSTDKRVVVVNESLRLGPVPEECFQYRLGNRSALEWVIDQYQVSKDPRSGIESDPNRDDDREYIVHLVEKVVSISVKTVRLINELALAVKAEDWLGEAVQVGEAPTLAE